METKGKSGRSSREQIIQKRREKKKIILPLLVSQGGGGEKETGRVRPGRRKRGGHNFSDIERIGVSLRTGKEGPV